MVKPEKFGHFHLVYHFTVPLIQSVEMKNYIVMIDGQNCFNQPDNSWYR